MTAEEHIELGRVARNQGHLVDAAEQYRIAAGMLRDEPLRYAHTIRHVADILRNAGQLQQAEPGYLEALEIYRAHPERNALDFGNAVRGYACLASGQHETAKALPLWIEAREIYQACGIKAGIEESTRRIDELNAL